MRSRIPKRRNESRRQMQARIVAETSAYITECLRHPELAVRIPVVPAARAQFPRSLTFAFWEPILNE